MSELSREQVELIALSFADDGMSYEQRQAMQRMIDTDAAHRDKLEASEAECASWRTVLNNEREAARKRLEAVTLERDEWKKIATDWSDAADLSQQSDDFYNGYSEKTMRAMQALLTKSQQQLVASEQRVRERTAMGETELEGNSMMSMTQFCTHANDGSICITCMGRTPMSELSREQELSTASLTLQTQKAMHDTMVDAWTKKTRLLDDQLAAMTLRNQELDRSRRLEKNVNVSLARQLHDEQHYNAKLESACKMRHDRAMANGSYACALKDAILWALGENGGWPTRGQNQGSFYWRTELRNRLDQATEHARKWDGLDGSTPTQGPVGPREG